MILAFAWVLQGCSGFDEASDDTLVVFAASSLTEAFQSLETAFERTHPGTDVQLTLAGSQVLRLQLEHGAQADVIASADLAHLDALAAQGLVQPPLPFATNELIVVVPRDPPVAIERFEDLTRADRIVVGDLNVPVGAYTEQLLVRSGQWLGQGFEQGVRERIVSRESNVRLVRAKVVLGEADAAIVYRTDRTDAVRVVEIPDALDVRASYPLARVTDAPNPAVADAFVAFVRSPEGQAILEQHGFGPAATQPGDAPPPETANARMPTPGGAPIPRPGRD